MSGFANGRTHSGPVRVCGSKVVNKTCSSTRRIFHDIVDSREREHVREELCKMMGIRDSK